MQDCAELQEKKSGQFLFKEIMMKEQTRTVAAGVQTIDLTYKEFELLKMFMEKIPTCRQYLKATEISQTDHDI